MKWAEVLQFSDGGLLPAIVQDADTGEVLMFAYMSEEALPSYTSFPLKVQIKTHDLPKWKPNLKIEIRDVENAKEADES